MLGVDGARIGWVGVVVDVATGGLADVASPVCLAPDLDALLDVAGPVELVAVDMPVRLVDAPTRDADDEARRLLGPRRSSVFAAPPEGALAFADDDYAGANAWSKRVHGRGLSKQAWFLVPRIREARALDASGRIPVHECSPELSFAAMAGDPLTRPKRTWGGAATRLRLLAEHGIHLPDDPGPAGAAGADDVVDAAAVAWSAARIARGESRRAPEVGEPAIEW